MALDDILNEHEERMKEGEKRSSEQRTILDQKVEEKLATFMKLADEIILPIIREEETKLKDRGYPAKIILNPVETITGQQFYDRVTFSFGNDQSTKDFSKTITFEKHDDANVLMKFIGEGQPEAKICEVTEPALKNVLEEFFKIAFR
jgi:hypothetical protein